MYRLAGFERQQTQEAMQDAFQRLEVFIEVGRPYDWGVGEAR